MSDPDVRVSDADVVERIRLRCREAQHFRKVVIYHYMAEEKGWTDAELLAKVREVVREYQREGL